jgi:D-sedoheptulose 7-phosphate isomerase
MTLPKMESLPLVLEEVASGNNQASQPKYFHHYQATIASALANLQITNRDGQSLDAEAGFEQWCHMTRSVFLEGSRQFLCGNGASAAFANHMALDWTKNGRVVTHSFSDSALLTAAANDMGADDLFAAPLTWYAQPGDQLVTISSSGNSPNILKAIAAAREKGMTVITLSGLKPDNASRRLGDLNFYIPSKTYGVVECLHQVLLHIWLDRYSGIKEWERTTEQNMRHDQYNP